MMLEGAGFKIIDIGIDVKPQKFTEQSRTEGKTHGNVRTPDDHHTRDGRSHHCPQEHKAALPPCNRDFYQTSFWINVYLGRDHTARRMEIPEVIKKGERVC